MTAYQNTGALPASRRGRRSGRELGAPAPLNPTRHCDMVIGLGRVRKAFGQTAPGVGAMTRTYPGGHATQTTPSRGPSESCSGPSRYVSIARWSVVFVHEQYRC